MGINGGGNFLNMQHGSPLIIILLSDFYPYGFTKLKKCSVARGETK